ncbi:MAG: segregation and condensation protein A [Desulfobacterales bacterium]
MTSVDANGSHPDVDPSLRSDADGDVYKVRLENVFEGPMDLLIHLIRKNEVDIYDIPIAFITEQYLEYLEWMKAMSIDVAGDFLLMAATLVQIKSRMLLPAYEGEEEQEDPRNEIARPLLEYLRIKSAADELSRRYLLGEHTFTRPATDIDSVIESEEREIHVDLFELIDAFKRILESASGEHRVSLEAEEVSIQDRIAQLIDLFEAQGSLTFSELFPAEASRNDIIVTFLAVLEMVKLQLLAISQNIQSGIIRLFYQ